MKKHASATSKMEELQPKLEKEAVKNIESAGISIDRYKSLAAFIQKEKSLQERLQSILVKRIEN